MKIIHHRYLNTNTMSQKKKNLRLYPPLIIIIIIIIIKFSKKASNLSKRMRLPPTKIEDLGAVVQS